jgi:hypothetical protein
MLPSRAVRTERLIKYNTNKSKNHRMKRNTSTNGLIAVAICLVVGCASDKQPSSQVADAPPTPDPGKGLIVFYRESHFAGGGVPFRIFEANTQPPTKIVDLSNGRYFAHSVTPGKHRFVGSKSATLPSFDPNRPISVTDIYFCDMNIESNTTYYAHAELVRGGLITQAKLSVVDAPQGSEAIKTLRSAGLSK